MPPLNSPVEFRHYLRRAELSDLVNGLQPVRQNTIEGPVLFCPPVLQFRFKVKTEGGVEWSPWQDILYVREGDQEPH